MTVKSFWRDILGTFRDEDRVEIRSLPDKRVVVDTSSWVHKFDGVWEVAYARTSSPTYPHHALRHSFSGKIRALKSLGLHLIFVFDGKCPNMKKRTRRVRDKNSLSAREKYCARVGQIKSTGESVSDEERNGLLKLRRQMARPTPEDYATLRQWMEDNNVEYVQAPFEADAQMKQMIVEGRATAAITEDGDLVVFEIEHILSQAKVSILDPKKSTCQYFDMAKLKAGDYNSALAAGKRSEYLPELSCLAGNDYIDNLQNVGPAAILGTWKKPPKNKKAELDSLIERTESVRDWLVGLEQRHPRKSDDAEESSEEDWSVQRFINVRNLIHHYPVFKKCPLSGEITLEPLNLLPSYTSYDDWGRLIGFDKHSQEYFAGDYKDYYCMDVLGYNDRPYSEHLGPRYSDKENPTVDPTKLLPIFTRLHFDVDPIEVQPACVLGHFLLNRGVVPGEDATPSMLRDWARRTVEVEKQVLNPEMALEPVKWVGFEPLEELALDDKYDDWVSTRLQVVFLAMLKY